MCLQEVDRPWALALKNFSSYRFVQPNKVMTHMYMTTLMYNTKTMELIEGDSIPYQHGLLKRNRRITYGVFRIRSTHQKIIVVSTHLSLVFNDDPRYLKTMSMQVSQLYDTVNKLVRQYRCPVVIGGDFNCVPDMPLSQTRDASIIYKQLWQQALQCTLN
jgi:endonuclease/exonuclease/phosphatase family metal-dependent hydrolase